MGMKQTCLHVKRDGDQCRAHAQSGSRYCFFHDPDKSCDRTAARQAGGRERSHKAAVLPTETPDHPLRSADDVGDFLKVTMNQVRRGQLDPKISNSLG